MIKLARIVPVITTSALAANDVLAPQLDSVVLAEIRSLEDKKEYTSERYSNLVFTNYYPKHVLRMPIDKWPNPVNRAFANINGEMYLTMQGPSEFSVVGNAKLKDWDRSTDL